MDMKIVNGCTRKVLLIGKYAIKIPQTGYTWALFLNGLLGNMQEVAFYKTKDKRLCPVLFSFLGGWLLVMPRCEHLPNMERPVDIDYFWKGDFKVPVEYKPDSFGIYQNRIVALDYGSQSNSHNK